MVPRAAEVRGKPNTKNRAARRKKRSKKPDTGPAVTPMVYSIPTFCRAHLISPAMYFKLKRAKRGPREMAVSAEEGKTGRVTISMEAAAAWRKEREEEESA